MLLLRRTQSSLILRANKEAQSIWVRCAFFFETPLAKIKPGNLFLVSPKLSIAWAAPSLMFSSHIVTLWKAGHVSEAGLVAHIQLSFCLSVADSSPAFGFTASLLFQDLNNPFSNFSQRELFRSHHR